MRISAVLLLIFCLAGCKSGNKSDDAVRQGVVEYLQAKGFDIPKAMTVSLTNVQFNGDQADATVAITPTGGNAAQAMSMKYHLEQKGGKWTVAGKPESGHGGGMPPAGAAPPGASPHGQGGEPGATKMPSPEDLPPAKKQ